ncbi:MAG: DUF4331 family protein [Acidimicrobiales bacterium]
MRKLLSLFGLLALVASVVATASFAQAADHLEAPFVQRDGRTDINDIYAFQSPTNPDNSVFIMTVNPLAGVASGSTFDRDASYDFLVDTDGDTRTDQKLTVRFGNPRPNGVQRVRLKVGLGAEATTVLKGGTNRAISGGGITLQAGTFDDPFFFDLQAFLDQVKGQGGNRSFCDGDETDFFAGANVSAIVIEVPNAALGGPISAWARTRVGGTTIDRMGIPAIGTVLIPDGLEDAYNGTHPAQDDRFWKGDIEASLLSLSGLDGTPYSAEEAAAIADVLSPDVVPYDPSNPAGFNAALNGRHLDDDVIDAELGIVTGGFFGGSAVLTSDCVDNNDVSFRNSFPYLAEAH